LLIITPRARSRVVVMRVDARKSYVRPLVAKAEFALAEWG
jgi:hypothetical protein